jgi:hypothetical protein
LFQHRAIVIYIYESQYTVTKFSGTLRKMRVILPFFYVATEQSPLCCMDIK